MREKNPIKNSEILAQYSLVDNNYYIRLFIDLERQAVTSKASFKPLPGHYW